MQDELLNFKYLTVKTNAINIANKRFVENVKYIYRHCDEKSLDNGQFYELCEILGFCDKDTIDRNINIVALSEIIKHKNNISALMSIVIDRILDCNDKIDASNYNYLCIKMMSIVCAKQDILHLYAYMIAKLDFNRIKAIQDLLDQ